jgi:hypothetical protein
MDAYEIESKISYIRNYVVPVPETHVTCYIGRRDNFPGLWTYSLWTGRGDSYGGGDTELISVDSLDMTGLDNVTALQVARIAYLCDVEYADTQPLPPPTCP